MQRQKLEKRGSWSGFESSPVGADTSNELTRDFKRCYSTKDRGTKTKCLTSETNTDSHLCQNAAPSCDIAKHLDGCHSDVGGAAGVQTSHGVPNANLHPERQQIIANDAKVPACSKNKLYQDSSVSWPRTEPALPKTDTEDSKHMAISSRRLHVMENQLTELHQQLQHLKNVQNKQESSPSISAQAQDQGICLENMTRQLNIAKGEKHEMRSKIGELERDLAVCHQKSKREGLARDRLQAELRRLADMIASTYVEDQENAETESLRATESNAKTSSEALTEGDVNALKEQLRIFEEDFTNERSDSERLRVQNIRLMKELEEAKRVIEEQQRQLLLYAHLTSNETTTSVVLSPINDSLVDRRSRSVPSTPNSSPHSSNFATRYTYNGKDSMYLYEGNGKNAELLRQLPPEMRPLSDVVPRGLHRSRHQFEPVSRSMPSRFSQVDEVFRDTEKPNNSS